MMSQREGPLAENFSTWTKGATVRELVTVLDGLADELLIRSSQTPHFFQSGVSAKRAANLLRQLEAATVSRRGINDDPMTPGEAAADRKGNANVGAPWADRAVCGIRYAAGLVDRVCDRKPDHMGDHSGHAVVGWEAPS